eukprot:m.470405 g.470405  ORF g.470405 m.470405 type:complete len:227 (-) comp20369_c0_seq1:5633-6313(-)
MEHEPVDVPSMLQMDDDMLDFMVASSSSEFDWQRSEVTQPTAMAGGLAAAAGPPYGAAVTRAPQGAHDGVAAATARFGTWPALPPNASGFPSHSSLHQATATVPAMLQPDVGAAVAANTMFGAPAAPALAASQAMTPAQAAHLLSMPGVINTDFGQFLQGFLMKSGNTAPPSESGRVSELEKKLAEAQQEILELKQPAAESVRAFIAKWRKSCQKPSTNKTLQHGE